ncbi:unnamed protein product [Symbiodinium sp. CCMP2592]|nr:unnamed protein product [Symbiodinium sp. CCMP2592]
MSGGPATGRRMQRPIPRCWWVAASGNRDGTLGWRGFLGPGAGSCDGCDQGPMASPWQSGSRKSPKCRSVAAEEDAGSSTSSGWRNPRTLHQRSAERRDEEALGDTAQLSRDAAEAKLVAVLYAEHVLGC